jgi:shikimate kinase
MMGAGKSTVARELAGLTGWPYYDNDELLRRATGVTARDLLATRGESELRAAEAAALELGLSQPAPYIVAVAAGTIEDERLRRLLNLEATVVWLRADPHTLSNRASGAAPRPWLSGAAEQWLTETADRRAGLYAETANLTVETDAMSPGETAALIVERLSLPSAP